MKKKKLALLLAVAMTVTSIDSTAMMVNAADFTGHWQLQARKSSYHWLCHH